MTPAAAEHRQVAVGVSNRTSFPRPMTASRSGVTATAIHQHRIQQLRQVEIDGQAGRLIATGQVRRQNAGPRP
jgi:acyl-coenzyme A thioesterase PaaI-like protein